MSTITQQPDAYNLVGNLKPIKVSSTEAVSLSLKKGADVVFFAKYYPDENDVVEIDISKIIRDFLNSAMPVFSTSILLRDVDTFSFSIDSGAYHSFIVIPGGVSVNALDVSEFLAGNFLTWLPQTYYARWSQPMMLAYLPIEAGMKLKVKGYFPDDTNSIIDFGTLTKDKINFFNLQYSTLPVLFSNAQPQYVDVYVENSSSTRVSYLQRIVLSNRNYNDDFFIFQNSVGGWDCAVLDGARKAAKESSSTNYEQEDQTGEFDCKLKEKYTKHTGYLPDKSYEKWMTEFFRSSQRYWVDEDGVAVRILIDKTTIPSSMTEPTSIQFSYALSAVKKYLNLSRAATPSTPLEIVSPTSELFFLAPRLSEFLHAESTDSLLLPVQEPATSFWKKLSLGALKDWIITYIQNTSIGQSEHTHANKSTLDKILTFLRLSDNEAGANLEASVASIAKTRAEHLRKNVPDTATAKQTFAQGIEVGNYNGDAQRHSGAKIDSSGYMEAQSLKLWESLEVPELRYNRVDITVGDVWRSICGGKIESVDTTEQIVTLRLEDGEIGSCHIGDICMGIFHSNILSDNADQDSDDGIGNRKFAGFYTSYFRVIEVLDTDGNRGRFRYSLRPVSGNYPRQFSPAPSMTFTGYGSFSDSSRRSSVYETRTYRRYLVDVDDWEFTKANIAYQDGDLSNLSIFDFPITGRSVFLKDVLVYGNIVEVDNEGTERKTVRDRGMWSSAVTDYKQWDGTWWINCFWRCLTDNTREEPSFMAEDWVLLMGNQSLKIAFTSSNGLSLDANNSTVVTASVKRGILDYDANVTCWEWSRDSGSESDDAAWKIAHSSITSTLDLDVDDLGICKDNYQPCVFTLSVWISEAGRINMISGEFIVE